MTVALLDRANSFAPGQRIVSGSHSRELSTASIGSVNPQGNITALSVGEIYIHEHTLHYVARYDVYIAKAKTNHSWVLISGVNDLTEITEKFNHVTEEMGQLTTTLHTGLEYLQGKIAEFECNAGEEVDLTAMEEAIAAFKVKLNILEGKINTQNQVIGVYVDKVDAAELRLDTVEESNTSLEARIAALEEGGVTPPPTDPDEPDPDPVEPTKFYVLPLGGQSNMVGYGEVPQASQYLADIDIRIKQVSRGSAWDSCTLTMDNTGYGPQFNTLRGNNQDMEIIPATPCLDMAQNMFQHNTGGTLGAGLYIAKILLDYIPKDYGILIVPAAYGGQGFHNNFFGEGSANSTDMIRRIKHAMDLDPANKLLPFIWTQGEADGMSNNPRAHGPRFTAFTDWVHEELAEYASRTVKGFQWYCCSPTKWGLDANTQTDYVDFNYPLGSTTYEQCGVYANYAYLANTRDNFFTVNTLVHKDGTFTPTNREMGNGNTTGTRQIHYSTAGYKDFVAPNVANAIATYTFGKEPTYHTRKIHGGCGYVTTDNVKYNYYNRPPVIGANVSNPSTLESFAIKFNFHLDNGLYSDNSYLLSTDPLKVRWQAGTLAFSASTEGRVICSPFYSGAWIGDWNDTQEIVIMYKHTDRQLLLYLNGKLIDSASNVAPFRLPSSVAPYEATVIRDSISNLVVSAVN